MTKIGIASQLVGQNATVVMVAEDDLVRVVDDGAGDVVDGWDLDAVGFQQQVYATCVTIQIQIRSLNLILNQSC